MQVLCQHQRKGISGIQRNPGVVGTDDIGKKTLLDCFLRYIQGEIFRFSMGRVKEDSTSPCFQHFRFDRPVFRKDPLSPVMIHMAENISGTKGVQNIFYWNGRICCMDRYTQARLFSQFYRRPQWLQAEFRAVVPVDLQLDTNDLVRILAAQAADLIFVDLVRILVFDSAQAHLSSRTNKDIGLDVHQVLDDCPSVKQFVPSAAGRPGIHKCGHTILRSINLCRKTGPISSIIHMAVIIYETRRHQASGGIHCDLCL